MKILKNLASVDTIGTTMQLLKSSHVRKKPHAIAGLPSRTAVFYVLLFTTSLLLYDALWQNAPLMEDDSPGYLRVARDLSGFRIDQLPLRTPGYPLLLLLTGSSQAPTRKLFFTSLLLHYASIWLLASALYCAGLPGRALNLFGLLLILPPYVEYAGYVLAENLTEFMLVAGFVSFVTWFLRRGTIWLVTSAVAIAYSGLTRPVYQLLAFALAGCLLLMPVLFRWVPFRCRDMIKPSLVLIFTTVIMIGGYSYVNYRKFDYFGTNSQLGFALSTKTLRVIERLPDEYSTVREILLRSRDAALINDVYHTGYSGYINDAIPKLSAATGLQMPQLSKYLVRINLLLIAKAPLEYLREVLWAFCTYWFPSSNRLANMNSRSLQFLWAILHFSVTSIFATNLIVLVGTTTYMMMCKRFVATRNKTLLTKLRLSNFQGFLYILAASVVIYSALITCLAPGEARYRVPTDSLIIFMCFLGTHLWRRLINLATIVF
jgi:hypothetical protein